MTKRRLAVYPGTFDPITIGHVDIITRVALHLTDHLIIAIATNKDKNPLFSADERVAMVKKEIIKISRELSTKIEVESFENLLVDYAKIKRADVIVRGLRAITDFEYEFQMSAMNNALAPGIETVFLMATNHNQFISSGLVKEVARLGGKINQFVSPSIVEKVTKKISQGTV